MRYLLIILFLAFMFDSCKNDTPVTPVDSSVGKPSVSIKTPVNNFNAVDSVTIEASAADDKGVVKVEIYIDNAVGDLRTFYAPPYKYQWITKQAADGSSHSIYAKAYDADGNSATSDVIIVNVFRLQPGNFSAKIISDSLVTVKWLDNSAIESGFEIEQRTRNTQFTLVKTAKANDTTASITGQFMSDSVYFFRVNAKTTAQNSSYSNIDSVKFTIDPPSRLMATVVSDTLIKFDWEDNCTNETGFILEQCADGLNYVNVKNLKANISSTLLTGIFKTDSTYRFRIKAVSKYNSSSYASSSSVSIKIATPSDLKITSLSALSIKLEWKDNCTFDKWVQVERKTSTGNFDIIAKIQSDKNYFIDTALEKTNTYTYRLRAFTTNNFSELQDIIKINSVFKGYTTYKTINVKENFNSISFSPDGRYIAGGGENFVVKLINVKEGTIENIFTGMLGPVNSVSFSPDGLYVAACSQDNTIKIWRLSDGYMVRTLIGHQGPVSSISYSKDGHFLVSGSYDRKVNVWRVSDGSLIKSLSGHSSAVMSVSFSPDGDLIASGSSDNENKIKIWRMADTSFYKDIPLNSTPVNTVAFSPNSQFVASGYANGNIFLWYASSGNYVMSLPGHNSAICCANFNSDGSKLISSSFDKNIKIWRLNDGTLLNTLSGHSDVVKQALFSPDESIIASSSFDKTIRLWQMTYEWATTP